MTPGTPPVMRWSTWTPSGRLIPIVEIDDEAAYYDYQVIRQVDGVTGA